jgi:HlyD family secretion protein
MNKRLLFFILLALAIVAALIAYFWEESTKPKDHLLLFGNVDVRQVDLGFRVAGIVENMLFEEGDLIEPGTLMGFLQTQPYLDLVKESEANVASVKESLANAQRLLKRRQELISDGSVAQEELDNAYANFEVLTANVKQAEAALAVAQKDLHDTKVYAPTRGTILTRVREPGTVVRTGDPIYTLSVSSPVWIRAFVHEPDLGLVYPGMPAEVFTDTPGGPAYKGRVGFISPVSEFTPKTVETTQLRTDLVYRIRVYVDNPDLGLRQGMPVTVKLYIGDENQGKRNER